MAFATGSGRRFVEGGQTLAGQFGPISTTADVARNFMTTGRVKGWAKFGPLSAEVGQIRTDAGESSANVAEFG